MSPEARRRFARPALIGLALIGIFYFGPRFRREAIELELPLVRPACVVRVGLELHADEVRQYAVELAASGPRVHALELPARTYEARPFVLCADGARVDAAPRPLVIDREGHVRFPVDAACTCEAGR